MSEERVEIHRAANGFADVTTFSPRQYQRLSLLLMFRYGFLRWGIWFPPILDEGIYPSFRRWEKRILAGWDNWFGYYLLADNAESDVFLRAFYAKHCTGHRGG